MPIVPLFSLLLTFAEAAGPTDPSPFGVVCPWPQVGETGARWVRCGAGATQLVDWGAVEPEAGRFVWDAADRELSNLDRPEGLTPLPILAYTAPWASSGPAGDRAYPPRDLRQYARFVRESVARYRDDIRYWEVWNEPNIEFFQGTIPEYVDLLKAASVAAHQADPDCRILFGGTAGVDARFIEGCYEHGAGPYFDVMAVHPYQWGRTFNDGWHREKVERLRAVMARHGDGRKPVWFTEIGWSSAEVGDEDQARLLVQSFVSSLALQDLGVEKVFWFCVKDWGGPSYGLFAENGARKPSFEAYRVMTRELAHRPLCERLSTGEIRCYAFSRQTGGDAVLVYWSPTLEAMPLDLSAAIRGQLDGPLTLVDLYGREEALEPFQVAALTATPEPHYLRLPSTAGLPWDESPVLPPAFGAEGSSPREWWASVRPPDGTARLWLVPGGRHEVTVNLWNLAARPQQAEVRLTLEGGEPAAKACELAANACTPVSLTLSVPIELKPGLRPLHVWLQTEEERRDGRGPVEYELPVRIAAGPTIEFLANSHLERSLYLQPGHQSGCSESCRFGSEWTYRFAVPSQCKAELQMLLGAHQGGPFAVHWSRDGETWQALLEGRGNREWRIANLGGLGPGDLYLRISGTDCQLEELVLTWLT